MRSLVLVLLVLVTACGGTNGTDSIAGLTASNLRYGQLATLTLSGKDLDHDIQLIPDPNKCTGLTLSPATSSKTRTATCLVVGMGSAFFTVRSSAGYEVFTTTLQIPEPVTNITASNLGFGQINLTLEGDPNTPGIRLSSDKCTNFSLSPSGSGSTRTASCAMLTSGPVTINVTNSNGDLKLYSKTFVAPPPTTLSVWNAKYSQKAFFALPASPNQMQLRSSVCTNITPETSRSNDETRVFSCTINKTGQANFEIVDTANNSPIQQTTLTVLQPQVSLVTSLGTVVMELNPTAAPITVDNFLAYVNQTPSFYAGTIFHRVISNFVVQGGGFTSGNTMTPKTGLSTPITLESNKGLLNERGTVAMARAETPTNSATSQFYFNLVNNTSLNYVNQANPGYAVFGRVITGMDVIDLIATKPTKSVGDNDNVPVTDITILSAVQTQ